MDDGLMREIYSGAFDGPMNPPSCTDAGRRRLLLGGFFALIFRFPPKSPSVIYRNKLLTEMSKCLKGHECEIY